MATSDLIAQLQTLTAQLATSTQADASTITNLNAQVSSLQAQLASAQSQITSDQTTISVLQQQAQQSSGYYPLPALPNLPIVNYESLPGATPQNFAATLAAVSTNCIVRLKPNTDYFLNNDFAYGAWSQGGYACYAPHVVGLICDGTTDPLQRARVHLPGTAMSSTTVAKIPLQSSGQTNNLWALRIGPNQSNNLVDNFVYGIEFVGHNQRTDPNTGLPAAWNGLQLYYPGTNTKIVWTKFTGFSMGTYNSPPGETNTLSTYAGAGMNLYGVEVNGYNGDGFRAGSACSANGCDAIYWENVTVQNTRVSGVTFSTAAGKNCGTIHTVNLKVRNNANHVNAAGQDFCAINHEGVNGPILHENPDIFEGLDYDPGYASNAVALNNQVANADMTITAPAPFWHGTSERGCYGCFYVQVLQYYPWGTTTLNKQTKLPTVIVNGVTLTPINKNVATSSIDPTKNYVLKTS